MSYEIFYGLELIEQDGRFIPVVLHGSNNSYGFRRGRQVRERSYSHINAFRHEADAGAFGTGTPPFIFMFTKSGAFSYASIPEFAADLNEARLRENKSDTRFYIPITAAGVLKHFQKKPYGAVPLFPNSEEQEKEVRAVYEAEPPPHIWKAGALVSAVSSLYYNKALEGEDELKNKLFEGWTGSPLNPNKIIESKEREKEIYWQYLLSEGLTSDKAEAVLKYLYWCGRFCGFHYRAEEWTLKREVV